MAVFLAFILHICAGRTFFAGADMAEFGMPMQSPTLGIDLLNDEGLIIEAVSEEMGVEGKTFNQR